MNASGQKAGYLRRFTVRTVSTVAALAMSATVSLAQTKGAPMQIDETTANAAVQQTIRAFAQNSDRSQADALDSLLHPDFRVVFSMAPGGKPTTLDRKQYLQMVRDGKVGGVQRQVALSSVSVTNGFAQGTALMDRPDASFQGVYSLIQRDGQWLLLQEAVLMTVKPAK
jgi:ketosteroid isomerase-like protein